MSGRMRCDGMSVQKAAVLLLQLKQDVTPAAETRRPASGRLTGPAGRRARIERSSSRRVMSGALLLQLLSMSTIDYRGI